MYGRSGELLRLNRVRNDYSKPRIIRQRADESHSSIVKQFKDKKLMSLRLRLIRAVKSRDQNEEYKIQMQMREYLTQDRETGL